MRLLRPSDILDLLSISKSTLWRWVQDGIFPEPIRLTSKTVGWTESTINEWLTAQKK